MGIAHHGLTGMTFILYGRRSCHLCDRLEVLLVPHLRKLGATPNKRDIDDDPAWYDLYHERIPVLEYDGRVILEGRPSAEEVAAALRGIRG